MKKLLLLLPFAVMSFAHAQEKKNIVKTNVTAYAFRNINLSYERSINQWFSINAGFGSMPQGDIPFLKSFLGDSDKEFSNIQAGLTNFTIEPRFYLGDGYGKGFYLAPYYRYTSFTADNFVYTYETNDPINGPTDIPLNVSGKATANSVGLMLGVQFFLGKSKNWVLDWWIVGAHYGTGNGDFVGKSNRLLSPEEQHAIATDLEDINIPLIKYEVQTNANGVTIKLDGPWAGLRSGLSFGYRF